MQSGATRTELLARRRQIALARQGRNLLQDKREQLLAEFRTTARVVVTGSAALQTASGEARRAIGRAGARDGPDAVASAGFVLPGEVRLRAGITSVMGVQVPDISYEPVGRPATGRGYTLAGTGPRIDAVAERFEAVIEAVLEIAAQEVRLRRLAAEIGTTTRRVNALEHVVIPRLVADRRRIAAVLDEREREEHFRLKRIKLQRGSREAA